MTPLWFVKHQILLPAALIVFFNFTSDSHRITLEDNKLKNEINALKTSLTNSGYKTRLGIVLVAETNDVDPDAAERIANLRRATGLDSKSLFHLPGYTTTAELRAFVGNILAALQPACIEYYRDLSKHARRKRSRGSTPPPTITPTAGTSQTLAAQGWTVRYETKLGYFAEFRQEMDAAGRSYETAYEGLLDGEIFESLSEWSPRFNDHRMLADALAIRIIRCLLWTGQTSSAVQSWTNHKSRIRDLVDQRGKGVEQYGWQAWEARWSSVMGEIIDRVNLPVFHPPQEMRSPGSAIPEIPVVLASAEKSFGNDPRLAPWDFLHHSGYWFAHAAQSLRTRRSLARTIPPEDCIPPGQSPASAVASWVRQYDSFLCPEPHEEVSIDHSALLVSTLTQAAERFSAHEGLRCTEMAYLEIALEHVGAERWLNAMEVLRPLWQTLSWRQSGWWELVFQASSAMKKCALELEDWETYLAAEYELLSNCRFQTGSYGLLRLPPRRAVR
jgi:trafficking protein particle complex subunit 11